MGGLLWWGALEKFDHLESMAAGSLLREALHALTRAGAPDAHTGHWMRYVNPLDGGWAMPTIATWLTHLPKGFETRQLRATDGQTIILIEGELHVEAGDKSFTVGEGDVIRTRDVLIAQEQHFVLEQQPPDFSE